MNKQKILAAVFVILGVIALTLVAALFFTREVKERASPADLSLSAIISRCETALDEFVPGAGNPPQRACKVEEGSIRVFSSGEELDSEIGPGDTAIISLNLPGILSREPTVNVLTGEEIARPAERTRLCFVTYPVLMRENMQGYPDFDEDAFNLFYENRRWSYHPPAVFDAELEGNNFICSNALYIAEFPRVSFEINIPSRDILMLGQSGFDARTYGVKIVSIPDNFLPGITMESIVENYKSFHPIYLLKKPIIGK